MTTTTFAGDAFAFREHMAGIGGKALVRHPLPER
jgi:hypothetical protein